MSVQLAICMPVRKVCPSMFQARQWRKRGILVLAPLQTTCYTVFFLKIKLKSLLLDKRTTQNSHWPRSILILYWNNSNLTLNIKICKILPAELYDLSHLQLLVKFISPIFTLKIKQNTY